MKGNLLKKSLLSIMAFLLFIAPLTLQAKEETTDEFSVKFVQEYVVPGDTLEVEVSGSDDYHLTWTFDGNEQSDLADQTSYNVKDGDLQKLVKVTAESENEERITIQKLISKLPVVYIDIANGEEITTKEPYRDAVITIQSNEVYKDMGKQYSGATEIKGRGNSTWSQPKKPYRLKLDKKSDVFGMGKNKHWVLLANYLDASLMRNTIAYNLSGEMGLVNTATVHVDVVINGSKRGNYQLAEHIRIDDNRVPVFDWEGFGEDTAAEIADVEGLDDDTAGDMEDYLVENMGYITAGSFTFNGKTYYLDDYGIEVPEITGGYAIELDEYYDEVSKFKSSLNQPLMFKGPEFLNTNQDMMNYVKNYVNAFEDAIQNNGDYTTTYEGNTVHYSDLYDMDALINYWLVQELFFNEDAMKKSSYCYKEIGEKMKMGPIWDMDWAASGEGSTSATNQWQTKYFNAGAQGQQWYKFLIQDPYYNALAYARYHEVRPMFEEIIKDGGTIDWYKEYLAESGADNSKIWPRGTFASESEDFHQWIKKHVAWMDEQFASTEKLNESLAGIRTNGIEVTMMHSDGTAFASKEYYDGVVLHGKDIQVQSNKDVVMYVNNKEFATLEANKTYTFKQDEIITVKDDTNVVTFASNAYGYADLYNSVTKVLINEDVYVESIELSGEYKSEYYLGDTEFDTEGLVVTAKMSDGSSVDVTKAAEISGFDTTQLGTVTMNVSYANKVATFDITVLEPQITQFVVEGVSKYELYESFDKADMIVKAVYVNGLERDVTDEVEFSDVTFELTGENAVEFTYKEYRDCFFVTVYNHTQLAQLIETAEKEVEHTDFYQESSITSLETEIENAMNVYTIGSWKEIDEMITKLSNKLDNMKVLIGDVEHIKAEASDYKTITITWDAATNAQSYNVYRKAYSSNKYVFVANVYGTSYASTVKTGKEYGYQVSAVYGNQEGKVSEPILATTQLEGKPKLSIKKLSSTTFKLNWTKVDGATRYIIYRKRNTDSWRKLLTLGGNDFTFTTSQLPKGDYSFIVKAARYDSSDRVMTAGSNAVTGTSVYAKPELTLNAGTKQIKAVWKEIEGVKYYELYRATSKTGSYKKLKTTQATSFTSKSLSTGKTYYFKVRGYKSYNNGKTTEKIYTSFSDVISAKAK